MPIRTDLVIECREMFAEEISGVESNKKDTDGITVTHVKISTPEGAEKIGRPMGNYVTIEICDMQTEDEELCQRGAEAVCEELKKMINISPKAPVLVAGLGNRSITPDSIGPRTADKLTVTRHITKEFGMGLDFDIRAVSAVVPGVLGITGIETGEILLGITEKVKPSLIIAVDALASRKISRLGTTVQICDTGISPGSGVGNNRKEISKETMGVPVISIGVPMVVDAATLTADVMESVFEYMKESGGHNETELGNLNSIIDRMLADNNENMVVTPNDVDVISEQAAKIIAEGINRALF